MTCSCVLDYTTVAAADKFGNIAVVSQYLQLKHVIQLLNGFLHVIVYAAATPY